MAALKWTVLLASSLVLLVSADANANSCEQIAVPRDIYPGYCIKQLESKGQLFSLLDTEFSRFFSILNDGLLMPVANISHFVNKPITLVVKEESENGTNDRTLVIHVVDRIRMKHFQKDNYHGSVLENQPARTVVDGLEFLSGNPRVGSTIKYRFVAGDHLPFSIVKPYSNSSYVEVVTNRPLDREVQKEYAVVLRAEDGEKFIVSEIPVLIKVLDVNDNAPTPTQNTFDFQIPVSTKINSFIGTVNMTDKDGDSPVYHFVSRSSMFSITPKNGEIWLIAEPKIQRYSFQVRAHDNRKTPLYSQVVAVFIDVVPNVLPVDKMPESNEILSRSKRAVRPTKSYEYKETDGNAPGRIVFQLDRQSPHETYKIESPNRWVDVDNTGAVKVKEPWDYEQLGKERTIDFWVIISGTMMTESERQRIIIHIKDINDEPPYFINRPLPMQAVVQLNAPPGTQVFKLQARDPDTDHNIHYFLVRDRTGGRFEVDERSGEVRTRGSDPFLLDKEYVLYVKAEDHSGHLGERQFQSTPEERLSIMGGKRPPQFYLPKYEATIPENQRKDSDIKVAKR